MAPKHQTKDLNSQIAVFRSQIRIEASQGMACDLPFVSPLPLGLYFVPVRCLSGHGHPTIWTSQRRQSARSSGRTRPGEDTKFHLEELEFNHGLERRFRIGGVKAFGIRLVELATVPDKSYTGWLIDSSEGGKDGRVRPPGAPQSLKNDIFVWL